MDKLIIHHNDGSKTEVEPMKMWQPYVKCNYPPHDCENEATWLYKNFKATRPIEICKYHANKIREGKTGILLRLCQGDENQLDESLTGHKYHCPKCDVHLTSLGLCANCGTRFEIESRRTSGAVDGGEGSDLQAESTPEANPAPEVLSRPTHHH